jgi:hypothetical protein
MSNLVDLGALLGSPVREHAVRELGGGAVSERVERWTVRLADDRVVDLVFKRASGHEIAGLRAAQEVRPAATAVPSLVAAGSDWLMTPFVDGERAQRVPPNVLRSLALLHTRFLDAAVDGVSRVDLEWWHGLCLGWIAPRVAALPAGPGASAGRAADLVARAAAHPGVPRLLGRLHPTLLHGDVHLGNLLVSSVTSVSSVDHDEVGTLIDWGSARVGPAMLDLANVVPIGALGPYREAAGSWLTDEQIDLGYRWAALQIPLQYLPWTAENRPPEQVAGVLDQIEIALAAL